jgi:two-component system, cell cycle sensor histidine kinase and response regulator CckA
VQARTILIIDDEEPLRQMTAAMLEREGFKVLQAGGAEEASDVWAREHARVDLLLTDIVMPGLSGPEIAREFLTLRPDLKIIITSGYTETMALDTVNLVKGAKFLRKPYVRKALIDMVASCFEGNPGG